MHKINLVLVLTLILSNSLFADENSNIHISDAWINEAPPTVSVLAAYAIINNISDNDQTLVSVTSPSFEKVELHLSKFVNEMAIMEKQESITIPAKKSLTLSPGAYHLMLFNSDTPLKTGDKTTIEFIFEDGSSYKVDVPVMKNNNSSHEHHHHHHHH